MIRYDIIKDIVGISHDYPNEFTEDVLQKLNIAIKALEEGIKIKQNTMYYKDAETCLDDIEENNNDALKQIKGE